MLYDVVDLGRLLDIDVTIPKQLEKAREKEMYSYIGYSFTDSMSAIYEYVIGLRNTNEVTKGEFLEVVKKDMESGCTLFAIGPTYEKKGRKWLNSATFKQNDI